MLVLDKPLLRQLLKHCLCDLKELIDLSYRDHRLLEISPNSGINLLTKIQILEVKTVFLMNGWTIFDNERDTRDKLITQYLTIDQVEKYAQSRIDYLNEKNEECKL